MSVTETKPPIRWVDQDPRVGYLVDVGSGRRYAIPERLRIGRDGACHIQLSDLRVSRQHAEVKRQASGDYSMKDLSSRAGTFVGGQRITEVLLVDGDEIVLGGTRLRFEQTRPRSLTMMDIALETPTAHALPSPVQTRVPVFPADAFPEPNHPAGSQLDRDYDKLRAVLELVRALASEFELSGLLTRMLETTLSLLGAERGAVVLFEPGSDQPQSQTARSLRDPNERWVLSRSIIDEAVEKKEGVLSLDATLDSRFVRSASAIAAGVRSVMCAPMLDREGPIGVIYLDSPGRSGVFRHGDLELLVLLASQSAVLVKNAALRRRLDVLARSERERMQRTLRGLRDAVITLDHHDRVTLLNPRAEELLPAFGEAALGETLSQLAGHDLASLAARDGEEVEVELPGPPRRIVRISATRASSAESNETETVLVLRDVTEARLREDAAARTERLSLVGQLAGGVAHDFNNLLCVISSCAEMGEARGGSAADDFREIGRAAEAAATLTRQLLAFSRREHVQPRVIVLNDTVLSLEKMLRRTVGQFVDLRTRLEANLWRTKVDPGHIEQIVMNFVVNARDAMPSGGLLTLETANAHLTEPQLAAPLDVPPGRYVCLTARDTGTGMPPEIVARIFEPFFTTKGPGKGTGLGLATVYGIVKQCGGAVRVQSVLGQGTTFEVFLPASTEDATGAATPHDATEGRPGAGRVVLFIDDNDAIRRVASRALTEAGFQVYLAQDGDEALATAGKLGRGLDLVITDVVMPGLTGPEVYRRLAVSRPGTKLLFVSGNPDGHLTDPEMARHPFLRKPFGTGELVRRALELIRG